MPVLNDLKQEITTILNDSNSLISNKTGCLISSNLFTIDNQNNVIGTTDNNQMAVYKYETTTKDAVQLINYLLSALNTDIQFSYTVWPKYYENVTTVILQAFGTWL